MTYDFGIVIPHLDETRFLEVCLRSILFQEGDATAQVHIQDGGTGSTVAKIVDQLNSQIDPGRFALTHSQEPDQNAADAINKGMDKLDAMMVSWLGADDILLPGCFQALKTLERDRPNLEWVTGQPQTISESGVLIPVWGLAGIQRYPTGFSRQALRYGLHANGPNHGVIQQEGSFWSSALWSRVGGLDTNLKLAFDFDLWCRLADYTALYELVTPLAAFRKRKGQASEDSEGYLQEVLAVRRSRQGRLAPPSGGKKFEKLTVFVPGAETSNWAKVELPYVIRYQEKTVDLRRLPSYGNVLIFLRSLWAKKSPSHPVMRLLTRQLRLAAFLLSIPTLLTRKAQRHKSTESDTSKYR